MSLRTRLLVTFGLVALAIAATALLTARTVQSQLMKQVDALLATTTGFERFERGERDGDHGRGGSGGGRGEGDDQPPPSAPEASVPLSGGFNSFYVGELIGDELVRVASPDISDESSPDPDLNITDLKARAASPGRTDPFTVKAVDGSSLRYRVDVKVDSPAGRTYVIGAPLDAVDESVRTIQRTALGLGGFAVVLLALAAWWLTRLGIRPIREMTAAASNIAAGTPNQRVPDGPLGTEAGQLGGALNGMLLRMDEAFEQRARTENRLRQFAADASHELRTPVQTIRGYGELYRMGALGDEARLSDAMRRTEQEAVRMGRIIDDLLLLARLDQERPLEQHPVNVAALARDAASDASAVDPGRSIVCDASQDVAIVGDEMRLRQVIGNLVANSLTHTPTDSAIRISTTVVGRQAVIAVSDSGPGMDEETVASAFDRFYRSDTSRSRAQGGSGLGLSIVRGIVEAHGGTVELTSTPSTGTTATVRLPLSSGL